MTTAITKHPNIPTSSDKCPKGVATHLVATHIYRQVLQVLAICGINPTIRTENGIKNALTKVHKAKDQWKATPTIVDVLTKTNHYANTYDTILNALPTYFKSHMKKRKKTDEKNHTSNSLYQVLSIMMYHFTNQVLNDDQLQQRKLLERGQYKGASTKSKSSKPFQLISGPEGCGQCLTLLPDREMRRRSLCLTWVLTPLDPKHILSSYVDFLLETLIPT